MNVYDALQSRRSIRKFLPTSVEQETVARIVRAALQAPSGSNTQPWKVHVVAGAVRARLTARLLKAAEAGWDDRPTEYQYYPSPWVEPYQARRRKVGFDLYEAAGIGRGDAAKRREQALDNFRFFGAPVALFVTIDRRMAAGSFLDAGMLIQSIMLAARAEGLDTCAQAIFCWLHEEVREEVGFAAGELMLCGMSLGFGERTAAVNQFPVDRMALDEATTFQGF